MLIEYFAWASRIALRWTFTFKCMLSARILKLIFYRYIYTLSNTNEIHFFCMFFFHVQYIRFLKIVHTFTIWKTAKLQIYLIRRLISVIMKHTHIKNNVVASIHVITEVVNVECYEFVDIFNLLMLSIIFNILLYRCDLMFNTLFNGSKGLSKNV